MKMATAVQRAESAYDSRRINIDSIMTHKYPHIRVTRRLTKRPECTANVDGNTCGGQMKTNFLCVP